MKDTRLLTVFLATGTNTPMTTKVEKMVAGNITIDKIEELKGLADTIDVSGALETNKVKDINKIKKFTNEIKKISYAN